MRAALLVSASLLLVASAAAAAPTGQQAGDEIAVATTSGRIVLVDVGGHRTATLTTHSGRLVADWAPAWSPDGKWLAFARTTDGNRSFHVYVMRADGSGVRQVTHGRFDESPAWSPDGRWIAYAGAGGIRIVHPNGRGSRTIPGTGRTGPRFTLSYATMPTWTPAGGLSYSFHPEVSSDWPASCKAAGARCGWVLSCNADGRNCQAVVRGRDAHWSVDGRIVFTPSDGGVATRWGGKRSFLGKGYKASWSQDGTHIVYARLGLTAAGDAIWIMDADGRNAHRIVNGASDPAWRPAQG